MKYLQKYKILVYMHIILYNFNSKKQLLFRKHVKILELFVVIVKLASDDKLGIKLQDIKLPGTG